MSNKIDYLKQAYSLAKKSPDPSTQLGAILVFKNENFVGGYNHFPLGVLYAPERLIRPLKYDYIIHAEHDTILKAARAGLSTEGAILYCPWFACSQCARAIAAAGIKKVIGHKQFFDRVPTRWNDSIKIGNTILDEAGVIREYYDGEIKGISILIDGELWTC